MNLAQNIIDNINKSILNEKASIDWNNYLTPEEVERFLSKDDKVESAENIVYDNDFKDRFQEFKKEGWTKRELTQNLANFYYKGHLTESEESLWKSQMEQKDKHQLEVYLDKLYRQLRDYNSDEIKSNDYYKLLNKIEYIESKIGHKPKLGRELH